MYSEHIRVIRFGGRHVGTDRGAEAKLRADHDLVPVDSVRERSPHPHVGEGNPGIVHRQDDRIGRRRFNNFESRGSLNSQRLFRRRRCGDRVHIAGQQGGHLGIGIRK